MNDEAANRVMQEQELGKVLHKLGYETVRVDPKSKEEAHSMAPSNETKPAADSSPRLRTRYLFGQYPINVQAYLISTE